MRKSLPPAFFDVIISFSNTYPFFERMCIIMRHLKITADANHIKRFVSDNAEYMILGGIVFIGMIFGVLVPNLIPDVFKSTHSSDHDFLALLIESFSDIAVYIFLLYFCGTSSVGFLSPIVLLFRGFTMGSDIGSCQTEGFWAQYMLATLPYAVLTSALLIYIAKNNIILSLRMFRMCTGYSNAGVPMQFRRFTLVCLISLAVAAGICIVYSLVMSFIVPLLV